MISHQSAQPANGWPHRLPTLFYLGIDELNRRDYFECHETLESLWLKEQRDVRQLYQGVLQIAVGCFHLVERRNFIGATTKLAAGARRLEKWTGSQLDPSFGTGTGLGLYNVDWALLIAQADRLESSLRTLGPEGIIQFDESLLPIGRFLWPLDTMEDDG